MNIQMAMEELKMENALLGVRSPMKVARNNLAIAALQEQAEREKGCQWRQEDEDSNNWECSACGLTYFFEDGDPFDNEMRFCPGCAKPIKSIKFREYDTENDKMVDRVVPADGKKPGRLK
jgi:rubredoxin